MPLIPIWVPIIVTIIGFLYIAVMGKFIKGFKDEGLVFLAMVSTWLVYGVLDIITNSFQTIFGGRIGALLFVGITVLAIALYVRWKKQN